MDHKDVIEKPIAVENVEAIPSGAIEEVVHWWNQPELRKLYFLMPFLFLGSTTLGYDGSLLNGLQAMPTWQECELVLFLLPLALC